MQPYQSLWRQKPPVRWSTQRGCSRATWTVTGFYWYACSLTAVAAIDINTNKVGVQAYKALIDESKTMSKKLALVSKIQETCSTKFKDGTKLEVLM